MDDVWGRFLGLPHGTTPAAVTTNKNIKMSSFKSSENIQKKEGGPDRSVSDNQSSSATLNELAMKARKTLSHVYEPFLIHLEVFRYEGSKLSFHMQGLDAPLLYMLLRSHLGGRSIDFASRIQGSC